MSDPKMPTAPAPVTSQDFSFLRMAVALERIADAMKPAAAALTADVAQPARPATQAKGPQT